MSRVVVNEIEAKVGNDITFNDIVKIDTFKGKTTAGSVTVQGEGSATTNLQQGLCKSWCNTSGVGTPALADSFNMASITDLGTGTPRFTFTNAMNNANFSTQAFPDHNSSIVTIQQVTDFGQSTTTTSITSHTTSAAVDADVHITVHGDLA